MAGAGRGRGRAAFTFNIEAIGFSKGEALPEAAFKPPPLFPSIDCKPVPLKTGEDEDYMLALKQELRGTMKKMPYFMPVEEEHEAIEKYSQKYQQLSKERMAWTPDWRRLPREIKPRKKIKKAGGKPKKAKADAKVDANKSNVDVLKKIEELEKKGDEEEKSDEEKEKNKDKDKEDEEEETAAAEEEYDEEEQEEENDYIASYFEDGDDFGADSGDNMDEATY
ncbi:PREDICTED: DNA-directed RNA polymerase III subunit RPC7 [Crocodylus porosus]|uniref:DNA-directed RNA polymerase III subunit RPC7 n=1 Tax=Crocodylus porosus TaxID=8502 RepID=UPI00093FCFFA|nr:PREDICTED: DNA-directed RNA polymerase III subunit RPC7 [Crocodylus porosus]